MKARLIQVDDTMQILLCTGRILTVDAKGALAFLSTFDDPQHYSDLSKWDETIIRMEDYGGQTIAVVSDAGVLSVENAALFRFVLETGRAKLLTIQEYASLHNKAETLVRRFCREGRLPGAEQKGTIWLIPEDAPYPPDERTRDGRRWSART